MIMCTVINNQQIFVIAGRNGKLDGTFPNVMFIRRTGITMAKITGTKGWPLTYKRLPRKLYRLRTQNPLKTDGELRCSERVAFPDPIVTSAVLLLLKTWR